MTPLDQAIAQRLAHLRGQQRLSLAQLAERSGVSKAMISKIERQDSSPTAAVLGRLASGLGVSLSQLLAEDKGVGASALRRRAEQDTWRDPASGYVRRQVAELDPASGSELVEIDLPPGQRIDYPCWHSQPYRQRLWVVTGTLGVTYGEDQHVMEAGDQLDFAVDRPVSYQAQGTQPCRYLLNILHRSAPA
ncbi:helix-turn-helix domain-containing protein [Pseudomonas sp. NPDC087029]|uniref:helix-turn-helix domain-containing protein n=1 Tax=Pseudomonas sp. NPDC087029 TaxID=3364433 RepID=UPI00380084D1